MSYIRKKTVEGLRVGDTFSVTRTFTEQDMREFAAITRDYNPVHFDDRFARQKNLQNRICHGLLVGGLLTEIGGQIGWLASGMGFTFRKPVYFGDTITCRFTITQIDDRGRATAKAIFHNQHENTVIEAHLTGILPRAGEKRIMAEMMAEGDPTSGLNRSLRRRVSDVS